MGHETRNETMRQKNIFLKEGKGGESWKWITWDTNVEGGTILWRGSQSTGFAYEGGEHRRG